MGHIFSKRTEEIDITKYIATDEEIKESLKGALKCFNINKLKPIEEKGSLDKKTPDEYKYIKLLPELYYKKQYNKYTILAYHENCSSNWSHHGGSLYSAVVSAYNNHEDIMLVPDDIWLTIIFRFIEYVHKNSEKLRSKFVHHKEKKELNVVYVNELSDNQWNEFFELMILEIKKNIKGNVVEKMECNFSTSGFVEKMVSNAAIMHSFQNYFDYSRSIPMCGIRNVCFAGTLTDWESILLKLESLKEYDTGDNVLKKYINKLEPIIKKMIDTYKGNVDIEFWNKIFSITKKSIYDYGGPPRYVTGWILAFYGYYNKVESDSVNDETLIDFPVKLHECLSIRNLTVRSSFTGIHKTEHMYRPQLSLLVCEKC